MSNLALDMLQLEKKKLFSYPGYQYNDVINEYILITIKIKTKVLWRKIGVISKSKKK